VITSLVSATTSTTISSNHVVGVEFSSDGSEPELSIKDIVLITFATLGVLLMVIFITVVSLMIKKRYFGKAREEEGVPSHVMSLHVTNESAEWRREVNAMHNSPPNEREVIARAADVAQSTDEPVHYDYVTAPVELYQDAHGESHMDEGRAVDETRAADVARRSDEPSQYNYVYDHMVMYKYRGRHINERRAVDETRATDVAQNTDEPVHYDYVTAPVELYQDAHGESHMNEGRAVDETRASDVVPHADEPVHYDYVTAPVELYQDAHGESHMDEGRAVDETRAADVARRSDEPSQYNYVYDHMVMHKYRGRHINERRAVDETRATDVAQNTDEPVNYDYVTAPVELYQDAHGESHLNEGRTLEEE
jgi:hypothetical protein